MKLSAQNDFAQVVTLFNEIHPEQKPGSPKTATNDENALNTLLDATENPKTSVHLLALNHSVSRKTIETIVTKEKFHPYKIHLVQELNEDNFDRRVEFTEIIMNIIQQDGNFINRILFSDESMFCLNVHVNRHNCRYLSDTNPYWMEQIYTPASRKTECLVRCYWLPCN